MMFDGTCYKLAGNRYLKCRLKGDEEYFNNLYLGQPHEVDANRFAYEQARKISGGKVPTPLTNMDDLLAAIEGFAAPLQGQFVGCAISMPGRIDTRNGIAHTGGMLSAFMWEQPFAAQVEARLGVPVTIANDGKCAAAAEGWTGALAGVENGLVLVLGTGIGGGIILNGKVLMGAHAAAGEVSGLVSDISKMADDDFKLTSVERYSEAPLWAGMASASGLILEYARRQKHLRRVAPFPPGKKSLRLTMSGSRKRRRLSRSLPGGWPLAS